MQSEDWVFYVKPYVKPEHQEEWKRAVTTIIEEMAKKEAFISFNVHQDTHEDNLFTPYERWASPVLKPSW